jgi:hypothetical protein
MSRSEAARLARNLRNQFLLLLCIALVAWRIDYRIQQNHVSSVGSSSAVAFFDANERNIATLHEAKSSLRSHSIAGPFHLILDVDRAVSLLIEETQTGKHQRWHETPPVLSRYLDDSVLLLPNPPPARLA